MTHHHINPDGDLYLDSRRARKIARTLENKIDTTLVEFPPREQRSQNGFETLAARLEELARHIRTRVRHG